MNGIVANTMYRSYVEDRKSILQYVYEIIDSKIDFIELKTRRLLDKFRQKDPEFDLAKGAHHTKEEDYHLPTMSGVTIDNSDSETLFVHFEQMSRSIYLLEKMKLSLTEDNVKRVMEILDDDKYLNINDIQIAEILKDN